jgi:glucose-6-phosphate isomerase
VAPSPRRPESAPGASLSVIRPQPPRDPIGYAPARVFASGTSFAGGLVALSARLDGARADMAAAGDACRRSDGAEPAARGIAFIDLPDRLLDAYGRDRPSSELFAILQVARRIRDAVDRVILLGEAGCVLGTRSLFESCCHPFHNELPRGERGGRPRLSFEGFSIDNDSAQGLLDLVAPAGRPRGADLLDRWGLIVVGAGGANRAPALATRLFLAALGTGPEGGPQRLADLVVPITAPDDRLAELARALGCADAFTIPAGLDAAFSPFTAAGLLPAAIVGMDVVRFLEGAAAMNRRFREAPVGANPVLDHAGTSHLAAEAGVGLRVLSTPSSRLESLGAWYVRLLAESLGVAARVASPLAGSVVAAPGSDDPQAGGGLRDVLVTHVVAGEPRRDRLAVPAVEACGRDEDGLDALVGTTWPELQAAAEGPGRPPPVPAAEIVLPRIDEHAIGQVMQMLMLSTVVEGRLRL